MFPFSALRPACLLACCLLVASACGPQPTTSQPSTMPAATDKFKLTAGPCAPEGYWATIQSGFFSGPQGGGFPVPAGHTLEGSWGASGTVWAVGDEMQPVPEHLELLWFSYAENKFYKGDFTLPQAKLRTLLTQGTWNVEKEKPAAYTEFTVCVLPKGAAVVWLTGGNQVLVGRFQGHEAVVSATEFARYYGAVDRAGMVQETREEMPPEVQAQIKAGTISTKQWDEYLKVYPWQVAFNVPFTLARYSFHGLNAERFSDAATRDDLAAYRQFLLGPAPKAVPRQLSLYGQAEHGANYVVRVQAFDEAEIQAAFQALQAASPGSPITLLFSLDKPLQKATLTLKNEAQEIALPKSRVQVIAY
jgi:hypothetical protein